METEIRELQELYNKASTDSEAIRKEFDGKVKDMPGDKMEAYEKAVNDMCKYQGMIDLRRKEHTSREASKKIEDIPDVFVDKGVRSDRGGNIELFGKKLNDVETLEVKGFCAFLAEGKDGLREFRGSLNEAEKKAYSVGSSTEGGFGVVPQVIAAGIIELVKDTNFMRELCTVLPPIPSAESLGAVAHDTEGESFDWTAELLAGNQEDTLRFGKRELRPHPLAKRLKVSETLVRKGPAMVEYIIQRLAYLRARTEENAFFNGTGANQPLGVLVESTQGVSTTRNRASASANVISGDDFWYTFGTLHEAYRDRATWVIHPNTEIRVRLFKDSTNNYIWTPGTFPSQFLATGMPSTICGRPYRTSYRMTDPSLSGNITTGTFAAVIADWKSAYWIVDSLEQQIKIADQLYLETNQVGYFWRSESDAMPVREEAVARLKVA